MNWRIWRRNDRERDLHDVARAPLEIEAESEEDALAAAKRNFGTAALLREVTRRAWGRGALAGWLRDARYALRLLRRSPGVTATVVLTLAAVIGANTAVFSVVYGVILRPLPYPDADELVAIGGLTRTNIRADVFESLRQINRSYQNVSPYFPSLATLERAVGPSERVRVPLVASTFFNSILQVRPEVGRVFTSDDARPGAPPAVVLGHDFWISEFDGDPGIVGRTLPLRTSSRNNNEPLPYQVVGVLPASFRNPSTLRVADAMYAPFHPSFVNPRASGYMFGRLRPGVTIEEARTEWDVIADRVLGASGTTVVRAPLESEPPVVGLIGAHGARERPVIWLFFGAVIAVLLIGIGNLIGVELAAMPRFEQELAVRAALGAGRGQLMRFMLARVMVVGLAGGILGIATAAWTHEFLLASLPPGFPRAVDIRVDRTVWIFSLALTILSSMVIAIVPAMRSSGPAIQGMLNRAGRQHTGDRGHHRLRDAVTAFQVAASLSLAIAAGLLVESYVTLTGFDLGFEPYGLTAVNLTPPADSTPQQGFRFEVAERLRMLDGVDAVTLSSALPPIRLTGTRVTPKGGEPLPVGFNAIEGTYFQTLRIPLIGGRTFDDVESRAGAPVAILSEGAAREIWPSEDPLGKRLTLSGDDTERVVIGLVGDIQANPFTSMGRAPVVYAPLGSRDGTAFVVARGEIGPGMVEPMLAEMAPNSRVERVDIGEQMDLSMSGERFQTSTLGGLAVLAVVLAAIGVHAVLAQSVARRTRELGVRIAFGALRPQIVAHILRRTFVPAAVGMALGLAIAYSFRRVLVEYLFRIDPDESAIYTVALVVVVGALVAAAAIPAYRAASLDPVIALRDE